MSAFCIAATGTNIGKTLLTTLLCTQMMQAGKKVAAYKPVISGFDVACPEESDTGRIMQSLGLPLSEENIARISPWRFAAPLAPNMAAAREGKTLVLEEVVAYCREAIAAHTQAVTLIETAGGVMTPLTDRHTMLDWMAALDIPVILVAGGYLGTISHTLTAAYALAARGIEIRAVVVNEYSSDTVPLDDTVAALKQFLPPSLCVVALEKDASPVHSLIDSLEW